MVKELLSDQGHLLRKLVLDDNKELLLIFFGLQYYCGYVRESYLFVDEY